MERASISALGLGFRAVVIAGAAMVSIPAVAGAPTSLYWVDLEAAVQGVADGARARRTLVARQEALQRTIDAREARLTERRPEMAPADYAAALEAHRTFVGAERERLERLQGRLLRPILDRMRDRLRRVGRRDRRRRVLVLQDALLIGPPAACDRTSWLVRAYADEGLAFPHRAGACLVRRVLTVDIDRVMASLPESLAATARLQAFMDGRQADLDRRRRQQEAIAHQAETTGDPRWREELARFSADLDRRYVRYRAALREREVAEEDRLYATVAERLARRARVGRTWLAEGRVEASLEQCDGTEWALELMQRPERQRSPACGPVPGPRP